MRQKMLIIEDHLSMIEGYKSIFQVFGKDMLFDFTTASTFEEAQLVMNTSTLSYDIIILDISLKRGGEKNEHSGKELGKMARRLFPIAKIIIITSHIEKLTLYSLYRDINPEGFLIKSDFTPNQLVEAVEKVLRYEYVYSDTFQDCVKEMSQDRLILDSVNREILNLIGSGIKTKSLNQYIPLSTSAIDKRKCVIKEFLNIGKGTDEDIIREAKRRGLI